MAEELWKGPRYWTVVIPASKVDPAPADAAETAERGLNVLYVSGVEPARQSSCGYEKTG